MTTLAAIRPDDWNYALLMHVLGALLLVGGLTTALALLLAAWRSKTPADALGLGRLAFKTLLFVALPSWFIMRIGAEWIYSKEGFNEDVEISWLNIGFITADAGGLLLLITIILGGISARRLRTGGGTMGALGKVTTVLAAIILIAYVVAVWAMGAKPS
jgi:hypothetical protein